MACLNGLRCGLLLAAVAGMTPAHGSDEPGLRDLMHARSFGMGGAYRAHGLGAEATGGNPAAIALFPRYVLELSGAWDMTTKYGFGTAAVADSTNPLSAGVSYHFVSMGRGEDRRLVHLNTVATAYAFGQNFSIGSAVKHVLMTGSREANAITLDAGLSIKLFDWLVLGASGHNLIDIANPEMTRYYSASVALLIGPFTAAGDVRADFGLAPIPQFAYNVGAEFQLVPGLPLRAGYAQDTLVGTQQLGFGLGFEEGGSGIDLGYRHELGGAQGRLFALTFKVRTK